MTGPTIPSCTFTAFVDLAASPRSIRITDSEDGHTLMLAWMETGAHVVLYLTAGSLAALRDAITAHLASGEIS